MSKIQYIPRRFTKKNSALITHCNSIIQQYQSEGYTLTLRQLYYRLVAADKVPNTQQSYDRVGSILNDARLAGLVDWNAIEDRTRHLSSLSHWLKPSDVVDSAAYSFRMDKWMTQPIRPEVWVEKEALAGIVARAASRNDVGYVSCRGYMSQSEMHAAALRFVDRARKGQKTVIIHLGDHDPSGIDMTRDIDSRLEMFMEYHRAGSAALVSRIALNMDQIEEYGPPPNPAKITDSRYAGYSEKYGDESWELDALEPRVLDRLIDDTIKMHRDDDRYFNELRQESKGRAQLHVLASRFERVAATLPEDEVETELESQLNQAGEDETDFDTDSATEEDDDSFEIPLGTWSPEIAEHVGYSGPDSVYRNAGLPEFKAVYDDWYEDTETGDWYRFHDDVGVEGEWVVTHDRPEMNKEEG